MYANLNECLKKKGISINAAAALVHMPEATFRTKVQERSFDTFNNNSDKDLDAILDYVSEGLANRSQRLGVVWGDT